MITLITTLACLSGVAIGFPMGALWMTSKQGGKSQSLNEPADCYDGYLSSDDYRRLCEQRSRELGI